MSTELDYSQRLFLNSLEPKPVSQIFSTIDDMFGEIDLTISGAGSIITSTKSGATGAIEDADKNILKPEASLQNQSYEESLKNVEDRWRTFIQGVKDAYDRGFNDETVRRNSLVGGYVGGAFEVFNTYAAKAAEEINGLVDAASEFLDETTKGSLGTTMGNIAKVITRVFQPYGSGEEPTFAASRDAAVGAWADGAMSSSTYKLNYLTVSPLDIGGDKGSLYGQFVLGTPFLFGEYADPINRTMINSFVKDGRIVSLVPGLPKYNGSSQTMSISDNYTAQTKTFDEMMAYLLTNGIGSKMQSKDRRYYTFEAKYSDYYKYLEAFLNTAYARMGLASDGNKKVSLLSFFEDQNTQQTLKQTLQNGIGFFADSVSLSESIDNQQTSIGSGLASDTNTQSDTYQKLNYLTGMGTGGAANNTRRMVGLGFNVVQQARGLLTSTMGRTANGIMSGGNLLQKIAGGIAGAIVDIGDFANNKDAGQILEAFTVTNGMRVMYPELWQDSSFNRSVAFDFCFSSPYGDPASIFKYVYVPFFALLSFAMPRMASDNGYVSPFFLRASVPGLFNSDLAMISSMTWQRGGQDNHFTKDGLPLKISGTVTIADLYPYLSSINHISCLSFNPSYSIWMDSFAGQSAIYSESETDPLSTYFKQMINRISGTDAASLADKLWNRSSLIQSDANDSIFETHPSGIGQNISNKQIYWMKQI